jgi:hypothetical protein
MSGVNKFEEYKLFVRDKYNQPIPGEGLNFSDRERWLPRVFIAVYALFLLGFIVVLLFAPGALGSIP